MARNAFESKRLCPLRCECDASGHAAFTLVELLVVMSILSILGMLVVGAVGSGNRRGKADSTRYIVHKLSDAILEQYEAYEDYAIANVKTAADVISLRQRIREEMPDSWEDVAPGGTNVAVASTAASRAYASYKPGASSAYAGAECLFMIVTRSGMFPDLISEIPARFIGDIDRDGKFEFWDGWGRPISFIRWAPGALPSSRRDPTTYHDPLDPLNADSTAFALPPLIFSPGPDESLNDPNSSSASGYGLISRSANGWPNSALQVSPSGSTPCTYNPDGKGLTGARDKENPDAYRDNISNYDYLFQDPFPTPP